jgi:hypothetical protein
LLIKYRNKLSIKSGGLVKITRNELNKISILPVLLTILWVLPALADQIYAPPYLWDRGIAKKTDPVDIADTHVGIPYRDDGTLDEQGHFTVFSDPESSFDTPGLNCSGLVLSISRFLFNKNWGLDEATKDRLGDSGENSPMGKDWDFGWDLVLNLTEGRGQRIVMPDGANYSVDNNNGMTLRGFDLHDQNAWSKVLPQMKPGHVYPASISKPGTARGYKIMHYHVVLMIPDAKGDVWLYHATHRSQCHKININSQQGMAKFMAQFRGARGDTKKILVVEAELPQVKASAGGQQENPAGEAKAEAPGKIERHSGAGVEPDRPGNQSSQEMASGSEPTSEQGQEKEPRVVVNHLSGKVFRSVPDLTTSVPKLAKGEEPALKLEFANRGTVSRNLEIIMKGPDGPLQFKGAIPEGKILEVTYPNDFGAGPKELKMGAYLTDVRIDGKQWLADYIEVSLPREALPKIVNVKAPQVAQAGKTFEVHIEAVNEGAESDYGGITVSCPDPSGLRIVGAKPGKVYGSGSPVLSITTDKIKTRVPMAERWIELWGENKAYDLAVQIQAGKPGVYPLYVRCALRGVNVKSSVVLMDPKTGDVIDQQGFPVKVYQITVR